MIISVKSYTKYIIVFNTLCIQVYLNITKQVHLNMSILNAFNNIVYS